MLMQTPYLERAAALAAGLEARAERTESARQMLPETLAELKEAGLHRMCQPRRYGGAELPIDAAAEVIACLARSCGSTAWVSAVYTDHSVILGKFDRRATDEVWGESPDALISAGYMPSGSAERAPGGWRIEGTWGFASGCDHADWLLLGSMLPAAGGAAAPHVCLVPRQALEIEDNWHVMGLCGTGSKNVVARGVVVPDHRVLSLAAVNRSVPVDPADPAVLPALYRLPHVSTVPFMFCATAIGLAESLLALMVGQIGSRASRGVRLAELPTMQMHVAEASAEIDCARLLMQRDTREAMALMREGQALELAMRVRNRRDQTYIVQLCRRAIDRLFAAAGSRGMFNDSAAQRRFRDMCAVSTHIALSWDMAGTTYGRVAFGLDPGPAMI